MSTTEERINKIIVDHLGVAPEKVTPHARILTDLHGDSLDQVELIVAIEEEFTIRIEDDEAEKCETVKDIYDLTNKVLAQEKAL